MRQDTPNWDAYFLSIAKAVAAKSKDPSTQVGSIIVSPERQIIATGYNGMPPGFPETNDLWQRPKKYDYVIHAERNAIARAAMHGSKTLGSTLYCTHFPCDVCAGMIVASGIKKVVADVLPLAGNWDESHNRAREIFAGSRVHWSDGKTSAAVPW